MDYTDFQVGISQANARRRNRFLDGSMILRNAFGLACARNHCRDDRIGKHELQRRGLDTHVVAIGDCLDTRDLLEDLGRCLLVFEV